MRQGCPLAAYLYILQAEPLAQTVRKSSHICGIKLPTLKDGIQREARISLFADDTQLFHSTEKSISEGFKILDTYCQASGAKLNLKKTKGLYIGSWKQKEPLFKQIKWVKNTCGLGAHFGYEINYEEIWMKKFAKFKSKITSWSNRDLTLEGKKLLINAFIMSSMSFLLEIYIDRIPLIFIKETKDLIRTFLWGGKTWRISQKTLAMKKCHGGLELPDLDTFIECKKVRWILKIHFSDVSVWNCIGKYYMQVQDVNSGINNFILQCTSLKGLNVHIPAFYNTCLEAWFKITSKSFSLSKESILNQNLFGNNKIGYKNNPLFLFNWTKGNVLKIKHIWDENINDWKDYASVVNMLNNRNNCVLEYNRIKLCIPPEWKQLLRNVPVNEQRHAMVENPKKIFISSDNISINGRIINYKKNKQKYIFSACLYLPHRAPNLH